MAKSFVTTLLLCIILISSVKSQSEPKNALYFEFLGNGGLYSINYERQLYKSKDVWPFGSKTLKLYGRGGLSAVAYSNLWGGTFPIECSVAFGKNKNYIESGIGCTFTYLSFSGFDHPIIPVRIGYRLEIGEYLFRLGLTPYFDQVTFNPWLGLSIGKRFDD